MRKLLTSLLVFCLCLSAGAADIQIEDAGVVRKPQRVFIEDAGVVQEIQRQYVEDAGTLRLVFENLLVNITSTLCSRAQAGGTTAAITLKTTGLYDCNPSTNLTYVTPTSQTANLEVFATLNSGTCTTGTFGSWLALTSDRQWSKTVGGVFASCNITLQIRHATTLVVHETQTLSIEADGTP